jgi:hypothetical protein
VKLVEPPSSASSSNVVFVGRNSRGQWVAQEQNGLFGGLFVNRAQALKYALFENGRHPETITRDRARHERQGFLFDGLPYPAHCLADQLRVDRPSPARLSKMEMRTWQC